MNLIFFLLIVVLIKKGKKNCRSFLFLFGLLPQPTKKKYKIYVFIIYFSLHFKKENNYM